MLPMSMSEVLFSSSQNFQSNNSTYKEWENNNTISTDATDKWEYGYSPTVIISPTEVLPIPYVEIKFEPEPDYEIQVLPKDVKEKKKILKGLLSDIDKEENKKKGKKPETNERMGRLIRVG